MSQDQTQIEETEHHLDLRNLRLDDYNDVKALMDTVYANVGGAWPYSNYKVFVSCFHWIIYHVLCLLLLVVNIFHTWPCNLY